MLHDILKTVRTRIAGSGKGLNENNTKATLIEPVLRELGWDVEDVEEVAREFKVKRSDKPVDYALLVRREPRLLFEAKGLGENLEDRRWANQIMGYAAVAGVEWIVLTDGNEYRIYNAHASVPVEQKLLAKVRVADAGALAAEILSLLAKDQIQTNRISELWRAHFIDRKVRAALEAFFSPDDLVLVNHIGKLTKDLNADEVRASLRRCKLSLDYPLEPDALIGAHVPPKRAAKGKSRRALTGATVSASMASGPRKAPERIEVTVPDLVRAGILSTPIELRSRYKTRDLKAKLLADGQVQFAGAAYPSVSAAASAAKASVSGLRSDGRERPTNGWDFWNCRGPRGEWALLSTARAALLQRGPGAPGPQAARP